MDDDNKLRFEDIPAAIGQILATLEQIQWTIDQLQPQRKERRPISIDEACKIIGKKKQTVYALSRLGEIPSCRQGRKVYFYEDELLEWINNGKIKTAAEIKADATRAIYKGTRRKP